MISSTAMTTRWILLVAFLSAIVATETRASSAFLIAPKARQPNLFGQRQRLDQAYVGRGGARIKAAEEEEELQDCGGSVASLFGNLRIPASLIAGASLGSAFALPMLDSDSAKIGMAKRLYAYSMVTTLGSMLLVVILSTIAMNDISIRPKRMSKNVGAYIEENYASEWMLVKSHFFYGAFAFMGGSAFRAYVNVACPVIGKGVIGILLSLGLFCLSYLMERSTLQTDCTWRIRLTKFVKAIVNKAKGNVLFAAGAITWLTAVSYMIYKIPHMYFYLAKM
mmetsp:Transcript_658/g.1504  ORF Transcript_658/g.1504 Transcript_658/m.1504 type:complete len:280 (+) Transcript_658:86-925(+)